MATVNPRVNQIVAGLPGAKEAVTTQAREIQARARALLGEHRETGESRIKRERAGRYDWMVSLVDPAALSIEYGHEAYTRPDGHHVGASQGLYVITKAAGL